MSSLVSIPCRCERGCVKTLTVVELSSGLTMLTIGTRHSTKSIMLDDAGRRELIMALGGQA